MSQIILANSPIENNPAVTLTGGEHNGILAPSVDLREAVNLLRKHFGIKTLQLEGGGHINGGFLQAGLVDEVSLLLVPGIDGRNKIPAVFDGVDPSRRNAVSLRLKSVQKRRRGALWIRYMVVKPTSVKR